MAVEKSAERRQARRIELAAAVRNGLRLALALGVALLAYLGALAAAGPLFELRTPVTPVDAIVVLGGAGPARAAQAASVYRQIAAAHPRVLISGDGDCTGIARLMTGSGVPPQRITVECASRSTWENAEFSRPLLEKMHVRSAILVTSWFHVRRALACFETFNPRIGWGSAPVERLRPVWRIAWDEEGVEAAKEYVKVLWYAVRYGLTWRLAHPRLASDDTGR